MDVLQATLERDISSFDEAADFVNILSKLSENEAILLARVYRYFGRANAQYLTEDKTALFAGLPENSGDYLLNRLVGKGLLNSESTTASDEDCNQAMGGFCTIEPPEEEKEDRCKDKVLILGSKT